MSFLTKLRYAGVSREELLHNYKQFIRTALEYCSVAMHSSLTESQSKALEHCQAVALRVILQEDYKSYESALTLTSMETLSARRLARCLDFSLKCIKHKENTRFSPRNPNIGKSKEIRDREEFTVNFARTKQYQRSAIPFCQRLLNTHFKEKGAPGGQAGADPGEGAGAGIGEEAGAGIGEGG